MKEYLTGELEKVSDQDFIKEEQVSAWMDHLKKELGIKGKPLFMGTRVLLTGRCHGPDLKGILALTPLSIVLKRFNSL